MTRRVSLLEEANSESEYQLPPGKLWWLCCFEDSEMVFTHEKAKTWFEANIIARQLLIEAGPLPMYTVTLYGQD